MKITDSLTITKRTTDSAFYGLLNGHPYIIDKSNEFYPVYEDFYNTMRATAYSERERRYSELIKTPEFETLFNFNEQPVCTTTESTDNVELNPREMLVMNLQKLIDFFSEFSFTPSFRFTNTFAFMCHRGFEDAVNYVTNYFDLMDSSYKNEVADKVSSTEFLKIAKAIAKYDKPAQTINQRFKIYYGPAGTGKTTLAQTESDNRCIVCNSSMLPSDLMEDFIFRDGNPDFNPSLLWDCMEQGKTIVLDEINLLPFDSLRFLQGIVDGKKEFYYKNRAVHIHDGFQIIGTMNLEIGGVTYGLPEPLVDRCSEAKKFKLTAEQLALAITGDNKDE